LTGKWIAGGLARHAVLEHLSLDPAITISAYDSDPRDWVDGTLISAKNRFSDNPFYTSTLSLVLPPTGLPCDSATTVPYWAQLRSADDHYGDNLPYDTIPAWGHGGYNSNSYVHGMLNATNGSVYLPPGASLVGWGVPVPASAFQ